MNLLSFLLPTLSLLSNETGIPGSLSLPEVDRPINKLGRPITILIEGNIASGKSTLLKKLAKLNGITTLPEPVEEWQNLNGTNLLEDMVTNQKRWMTTFQLFSSYTRLEIALGGALDSKVRVLERSLYSEFYCFVQYHKDNGSLEPGEYALLKKWFEFLTLHGGSNLGVDLIVYIRTDPQVLLDRIQSRGRKEEATINREFLLAMHKYHEDWLVNKKFPLPAPVAVIDGDMTIEETYAASLKAIKAALPSIQI